MKEPIFNRLYAGLLVLLLSATAISAAARPDFDREKMHERKFERIVSKLELSEDQVQQAEQLREAFHLDHSALREQIKNKRSALKAQSNADVYDETAVEALAAELGELHAQSTVARARHKYEFQQILTEEQRTKMAEIKNKRGERKSKRAEKRFERMQEEAHSLAQ